MKSKFILFSFWLMVFCITFLSWRILKDYVQINNQAFEAITTLSWAIHDLNNEDDVQVRTSLRRLLAAEIVVFDNSLYAGLLNNANQRRKIIMQGLYSVGTEVPALDNGTFDALKSTLSPELIERLQAYHKRMSEEYLEVYERMNAPANQ